VFLSCSPLIFNTQPPQHHGSQGHRCATIDKTRNTLSPVSKHTVLRLNGKALEHVYDFVDAPPSKMLKYSRPLFASYTTLQLHHSVVTTILISQHGVPRCGCSAHSVLCTISLLPYLLLLQEAIDDFTRKNNI